MVTGDNLLTALTVARECGMIESTEPIIRIELDDSGTDIYWAYYDIQDHVEAVVSHKFVRKWFQTCLMPGN